MKYLAALIVFTLSLTAVEARTVDCSSSNGQLQFSSWSYGGGAAPAPGMMSTRVAVTFKNQIIFEKKTYFPCYEILCEDVDIENKKSSNIEWELDEASRVILESTDHEWGYDRIFANILSLKSTDGQNMNGMDVKELKAWVLCEEHYAILP